MRDIPQLWGSPNGFGLPRPVALDPDGVGRPVPWTNANSEWGVLDDPRVSHCLREGLCLVCGEVVEAGRILAFGRQRMCPTTATFSELRDFAADHGPLHDRCFALTVAHCKRVRENLLHGRMFAPRYQRSPEVTHA